MMCEAFCSMPTAIRSSLMRNATVRRLMPENWRRNWREESYPVSHGGENISNRKENYTREAAENFKGRIFVPDDLEVIEL